MAAQITFSRQFFAISPIVSRHRVVLAGGLYPLRGPRSAYRASVACYDYAEGNTVWLYDQPRSYPFRAIAHCSGVCAALLNQNFLRCPTGMFRFNLDDGDPFEPACQVSGWNLNHIDKAEETFVFSWVHQETSHMRAVGARNATFQDRQFPYHSASGGKTIERVIAAGAKTLVAMFSLVQRKQVVYSIERWSMDSASPHWEKQTFLDNMVRNDSILLLWRRLEAELDVTLLAIESGNVQTSFRLPLADVVSIRTISRDSYAILSMRGVFVLDTASQTTRPVSGMDFSDFLDFGDLAVDPSSGKLIVITAGNHTRPGTELNVIDL